MELPEQVSECAFDKKTKICTPIEVVDKMAQFLAKLNMTQINSIKSPSPEVIVEKVKDMLDCQSESCIYKNRKFAQFIGQKAAKSILDENFKPEGPALTFDLLSNFNIDDVLEQLEKAYKSEHFLHIPFQMRDFAKFAPTEREVKLRAGGSFEKELETRRHNLASIDFAKEYQAGTRCAGVVLNTDYSSGEGIHWFALFIDMRQKPWTIEYFNSSGNLPLFEVMSWMKKTKQKLIDDLNLLTNEIEDVIVSRIVHQQDRHSCGIYALYYILSRLSGVPYTYFQEHRIPDKLMHEFRKVFFRLDV